MSVEGCDYSYDHPTPAQLKSVGKKFVVRYLTGTTTATGGGKNLTPQEADQLQTTGISIVSNYETTQGFMLNGYDAGAHAATVAWRQHLWCGGQRNRPIYFSLDLDATLDQWKSAAQFLRGAASVLGWDQVGMYGGLFQVDWAKDLGVQWLWQTFAWSYSHWSIYAHQRMEQYRNHVALGSGIVDLDRALTEDYGQWPYVKEILMADAQDILNAISQLRRDLVVYGQAGLDSTVEWFAAKERDTNKKVNDFGVRLDSVERKLDALAQAVANQKVTLTQEQLDELKSAATLEGTSTIQLTTRPTSTSG